MGVLSIQGPKGLPGLGVVVAAKRDQLGFLAANALDYGDVIPFHVLGMPIVQLNHPDAIRYVLMENHKNYYKSDVYIRFEAALGKGLLTSNGEKWRRDRQKIQPMFKREQVEGYYFTIIHEVTEKFKQRWLKLTEHGPAEIDITYEMAHITIEVILKTLFGKDNLDEATLRSLHHSYSVFMAYLKDIRLLPKVDFRKVFHTRAWGAFHKEVLYLESVLERLTTQYRKGADSDKFNMLALLIEAQKQDPEHFSDRDIRDHSVSMIFAGFETTSVAMQWMWYALAGRPDEVEKLRQHIVQIAPCTGQADSCLLTVEEVMRMDYLSAAFKETMRLYPPLWVTSRKPVEDDVIAGVPVKKGTVVVLPQLVMHRHPRFWEEPNAFIPSRFVGEAEEGIAEGLYFPFSQGPRKCSGYKFAELEARLVFAKLLPLFKIKALNILGNPFDPGISLKLKNNLRVGLSRA